MSSSCVPQLSRIVAALLASTAAVLSAEEIGWRPLQLAIKRHEQGVKPAPRIIGGVDAKIKNHPWQVALLYAASDDAYSAQFCGGSLIAEDWVVTAAHCVDEGTKPDQVHVFSGFERLASPPGIRTEVVHIRIHPKWSRTTGDSDIALIKLKRKGSLPVGLPIPVDGTGTYKPALPVVVSGWGATEQQPKGSETLKSADLGVMVGICSKQHLYGATFTLNMLCVGRENKDTCMGDSGGPATADFQGERRLIGITSRGGQACAEKPGIYTKVANFLPWIVETLDGDEK